MEDIILHQAILHILDSTHEVPIMSGKALELERDISDFLERHISKILNDGDLKKAVFIPGSNEVLESCTQLNLNKLSFVDISITLANKLFGIMKENPDIPSADVVFVIFEFEGIKYFSLIKFNYRCSYIHYVANTNEGNNNKLIKQRTALPNETQKVDECVIINLNNFELRLIEKKHEICAEKEFYLSKYFLKCQSDLSYLQKVKVLDKTASKISKKHFDEDFTQVAKLRSCIAKSIEEADDIEVEAIAEQVFGENTEIKRQYLEEVKKGGLSENRVIIPETINTTKKYRTQKLKTESGIEINFPSHFYNDENVMEFINNPDGSISILIKNVNKVVNK